MSDSLQPHGLWLTRLLHPWDFPGKSTGVGCHYLLCIGRTDTKAEAPILWLLIAKSQLLGQDPDAGKG